MLLGFVEDINLMAGNSYEMWTMELAVYGGLERNALWITFGGKMKIV